MNGWVNDQSFGSEKSTHRVSVYWLAKHQISLLHSYPNRCNEYNGHLACFTYWSLYEWAAIWLTTFSNAFTELKTVYFDKTVTEVGSLKSIKQSFSIGLGNCTALIKQHAPAWTNADPVHWRMYASPGINESIHGYTSDWFWYIAKFCFVRFNND